MNKKNQTYKWDSESIRFVKTFLNVKHPWKNDKFIGEILKSNIYQKNIKSILDVGCGNGDFLSKLLTKKLVKKIGIETSSASIKLLKKKHKNCMFIKSYCHSLPFNDNYFDFVYAFMVLHYIDRNNFLQSLGELLRVTNKYLMIVDFDPAISYFTKYKHKKNFYIYKTNYDKILLESGFLKKVVEKRFYINGKNKLCKINKKIKKSDPINHHIRKLTIYKKTITLKKKKLIFI